MFSTFDTLFNYLALYLTMVNIKSASGEMLVSWTGFAILLALFVVSIAVYRRYFFNLSDIPGPFWASVTRLWHVWIILEGKQNVRLKALHREHGPFVRIAPNEVSVCHPDGPTLLLRANLHKGDWYRVTAVPDYRFQNPMSTTNPMEKKTLSKHFTPGYALSQILKRESDINKNIESLLVWVEKYAEGRVPMDLDRFITYTTFDNIGCALFSEPFGFIKAGRDLDGTLRNNVALSRFAAVAGFFIGPLRILINPLNSWLLLLPMGHLYKTTSIAIKKHLSNPKARNDMVTHWLSAQQKSSKLTLRHIEAQANVNVGAGAEPVSSKDIWGDNADEWDPERWLMGDAGKLDKNWIVFSAGYMTCPGRHFAWMQICKVAATLLRNYDISQVDPDNKWRYEANFTALTYSWPVWVEKR
ncbi:hypothetical protein FANTH_11111 [Fusarium anthophilum]|uniref:Cytochrome P450 n=1 Tax=Fusarium anthophilum TaxID=48485 RepID=A0A8H5DV22_9HYPO|nr:hypothetical protein FANTH_11111 [Fusarium anthophilum]